MKKMIRDFKNFKCNICSARFRVVTTIEDIQHAMCPRCGELNINYMDKKEEEIFERQIKTSTVGGREKMKNGEILLDGKPFSIGNLHMNVRDIKNENSYFSTMQKEFNGTFITEQESVNKLKQKMEESMDIKAIRFEFAKAGINTDHMTDEQIQKIAISFRRALGCVAEGIRRSVQLLNGIVRNRQEIEVLNRRIKFNKRVENRQRLYVKTFISK